MCSLLIILWVTTTRLFRSYFISFKQTNCTLYPGIWLQDWVGLQHSWDGDRLIWNWELNKDHYPGELTFCTDLSFCVNFVFNRVRICHMVLKRLINDVGVCMRTCQLASRNMLPKLTFIPASYYTTMLSTRLGRNGLCVELSRHPRADLHVTILLRPLGVFQQHHRLQTQLLPGGPCQQVLCAELQRYHVSYVFVEYSVRHVGLDQPRSSCVDAGYYY